MKRHTLTSSPAPPNWWAASPPAYPIHLSPSLPQSPLNLSRSPRTMSLKCRLQSKPQNIPLTSDLQKSAGWGLGVIGGEIPRNADIEHLTQEVRRGESVFQPDPRGLGWSWDLWSGRHCPVSTLSSWCGAHVGAASERRPQEAQGRAPSLKAIWKPFHFFLCEEKGKQG